MITELLKKGQMLIIKTNGEIEYRTPKKGKKFKLEELQDAVGMPEYGDNNLIELAPVYIKGHKVLVNEEGIIRGMPLNRYAEQMLVGHEGQLRYAGNVVIINTKDW